MYNDFSYAVYDLTSVASLKTRQRPRCEDPGGPPRGNGGVGVGLGVDLREVVIVLSLVLLLAPRFLSRGAAVARARQDLPGGGTYRR